ncbi:hypothetical protein Tco_1291798 [Tanacetum coccineum]
MNNVLFYGEFPSYLRENENKLTRSGSTRNMNIDYGGRGKVRLEDVIKATSQLMGSHLRVLITHVHSLQIFLVIGTVSSLDVDGPFNWPNSPWHLYLNEALIVLNMIKLFGKLIRVNKEVDEKLIYDTFSAFGVIVTNPKRPKYVVKEKSVLVVLLAGGMGERMGVCDPVLMALVTEELLILYESMKITDALTRVHKIFQGKNLIQNPFLVSNGLFGIAD